ncbi:hypothetical protein ACVGOW_02220 [Pseudonocardia saturnea]
MRTTTPETRPALLAGLIDLADPARPPHPGGRPCGALCVPACTADPAETGGSEGRTTSTMASS